MPPIHTVNEHYAAIGKRLENFQEDVAEVMLRLRRRPKKNV